MGRADVSLACATSLIDRLARGGVSHACVSPGSRSTALALAVARDPRITVHVHLDERSAAYFALGLAKALRRPVAVVSTSGTAAAEYFPAVIEASQSRVRLILLTADRPPRLRRTGANQTIDQVDLYGTHVRAYIEPPTPEAEDDVGRWARSGDEAVAATAGRFPGPVQINCPFDEPLIPSAPGIPPGHATPAITEPRGTPTEPAEEDVQRCRRLMSGRRGVVIAGGTSGPSAQPVFRLAKRLGWPMIAEPTSGARRPGAALTAGVALAASPWLDAHRPDVVLQVGAAPTSRTVSAIAASADELIVADAFHRDPDVEGRASIRLHSDPEHLVSVMATAALDAAPSEWLDGWRLADTSARRVMDAALDRIEVATELQVTRDLAAAAPAGSTLFVGNSMPIRDLDYAMAPREGLRILANRGASGIDGLVSTAMGIAASDSAPTLALMGDLSFLHDAGALLWYGRNAEGTIVVPNNRGGRIFSILGQRDLPELEPLFVTPHDVDLSALCATADVSHALLEDVWAFEGALEHALGRSGLQVIEVAIDPVLSIAQRDQIQAQIDEVLAGL